MEYILKQFFSVQCPIPRLQKLAFYNMEQIFVVF